VTLYLVVVFPDSELSSDTIKRHFPKHLELSGSTHVVAADLETSAEVCQKLGIGPAKGLVVKVGTAYYGYGDRATWETMSAWEES
jgi:hypothetical protein